ncbi:MAG: AAA family ATPase, partial [Myxococcaceae bacterium]
MKKLPDNIADFKMLIEENYIYADKTWHLYQLLMGSGQNFFLSRPRRFGKTLLVSTLEQIFLGNRSLFKGLWIDQSDYTWPKYPVIRLSMAGMDFLTPLEFREQLLSMLKKKATSFNIDLSDEKTPGGCLVGLVHALSTLGKVVVLIDEYEHPILTHLHKPEVATEIREILKTFYGVLKDLDKNLRFVFLTGVTKFAKTSIFSGINNLTDLSLDRKSATILGLEPRDLDTYFLEPIQVMADDLGKTKIQILDSLRDWYNGYRFSEDSTCSVYNPCSVLKSLISHRFKNYWFETGTPVFLINLIKERDYPVMDFEKIHLDQTDLSAFEVDQLSLPAILFQTGYLTIRGYDPESEVYELSYPNKEVFSSLIRLVAPVLTKRSFVPWRELSVKLGKALAIQDLETFCKLLQTFFADVPYTLHIGLEKYYHTIFYMLMKFMGAEIWIEEATNIGRIDAVLQTSTHIYVIEFKLDKSAQEALAQIKTRQYPEKYKLLNKQIVLMKKFILRRKFRIFIEPLLIKFARLLIRLFKFVFTKRTILFVTNQKIRSITFGPFSQAFCYI